MKKQELIALLALYRNLVLQNLEVNIHTQTFADIIGMFCELLLCFENDLRDLITLSDAELREALGEAQERVYREYFSSMLNAIRGQRKNLNRHKKNIDLRIKSIKTLRRKLDNAIKALRNRLVTAEKLGDAMEVHHRAVMHWAKELENFYREIAREAFELRERVDIIKHIIADENLHHNARTYFENVYRRAEESLLGKLVFVNDEIEKIRSQLICDTHFLKLYRGEITQDFEARLALDKQMMAEAEQAMQAQSGFGRMPTPTPSPASSQDNQDETSEG